MHQSAVTVGANLHSNWLSKLFSAAGNALRPILFSDLRRPVSAIATFTASYRLRPQWCLRASWDRIVTNYDRDTDVIMGGIGYRF